MAQPTTLNAFILWCLLESLVSISCKGVLFELADDPSIRAIEMINDKRSILKKDSAP
jgi:hypothetical protein